MDHNFPQTTTYYELLHVLMQTDAHADTLDAFLTADTVR